MKRKPSACGRINRIKLCLQIPLVWCGRSLLRSRFWGGGHAMLQPSIAWHPKQRLRRRLVWTRPKIEHESRWMFACVFWTFWRFSGWIWTKLALIWSNMHLWHDSLLFLPIAARFMTFWLGHALKSKFLFLEEKVTYVLRLFDFWIFFSPFFFLLFFSFRCSDWPSTGLACG